MPVRKIPKNYRNVTGIASQTKAIGDAQFESTLERDFISLLEFSPEVKHYEVQPLTIEWKGDNGRRRSYTPDVRVEFQEHLQRPPWLCEVKYRADIKENWEELHSKFRRGVRHARQSGWIFHLVSEIEIRTTYLKNVRFLLGFQRRQIPETAISQVLGAVAQLRMATVEQVLQALSTDPWQQAEWLPAVWHLVANHRIGADLDEELTMISQIWSLA